MMKELSFLGELSLKLNYKSVTYSRLQNNALIAKQQ